MNSTLLTPLSRSSDMLYFLPTIFFFFFLNVIIILLVKNYFFLEAIVSIGTTYMPSKYCDSKLRSKTNCNEHSIYLFFFFISYSFTHTNLRIKFR